MTIYVVQPGDTIYSIAETYKVSPETLIRDNGILNYNNLVVGQTIVIVYPLEVYTVMPGDSLYSIAASTGVSPLMLLRNNPQLSGRSYLYPGEQLNLRYNNTKGRLKTNGYAYPFIDPAILKKTLPYLSFLTIFGYSLSPAGVLTENNDDLLINMAKLYGVAPIMVLSSYNSADQNSSSSYFTQMNSEEANKATFTAIIAKMIEKGYLGINIYVQKITEETFNILRINLSSFSSLLKEKGLIIMLTLTPEIFDLPQGVTYLNVNYSIIAELVDYILLLSYNWGYTYGPPAAVTQVNIVRRNLDYAVTQIPSRKIFFGVPIIGYDWNLTSQVGYATANSLTSDAAVLLAADVGATIQFDYEAMAPFFTYTSRDNNTDVNHIVWFKDARSIDVLFGLVQEYSLSGSAIWNIMHFFTQMWFIVNTQYEIIGPFDNI